MMIDWTIEPPATEDAMRLLAADMAAHYDCLTAEEAYATITQAVATEERTPDVR